MAKTTPTSDDEIDLIELIKVFLMHKAKFVLLGTVGLLLGLGYSYQHEPRYETQFKVVVGHPAFTTNNLINSTSIQALLNTSELNRGKFPNYSYNKKKKVFAVVTKGGEVQNMVTETFENALKEQVVKIKQRAQDFKGFDNNKVIINSKAGLQFNNQDLAKLNSDQVMRSFNLSFGSPKVLYPKPLNHGVIGIFIGLFLAFFWMMADILMRQLKKK
jgi:LPS O-antigen subunit length determinant protein (WzzB/FepE family)